MVPGLNSELCAFCRHWMIGAIDVNERFSALKKGKACTCHIYQPLETFAYQLCTNYDKIPFEGEE